MSEASQEVPETQDEILCINCGTKKTIEEQKAGHDFCFDCYSESQE